jgi:hypothetical protein
MSDKAEKYDPENRKSKNTHRYMLTVCKFTLTIFMLISVMLIMSNCSGEPEAKKQVSRIYNQDFSRPEELNLSEVFRLDSSIVKNPFIMKFDKSNNIYVLEYKSSNIKIFDNNGIFINNFITKPDSSIISYFNINNDTLLISYAKERKIDSYSIGGTKLKQINFENEMPGELEFLPGGNIIGSFRTNLVRKDDIYISIDLKLTDRDFNELKVISSFFGSFYRADIDHEIPIFPFAVCNKSGSVFTGAGSEKHHKIFRYDHNLDLTGVIENKIAAVKFTQSEIEKRREVSSMFKIPAQKKTDKTLIENLFCDHDGLLWVRRASDAAEFGDDKAVFDIFDNNGKLIKSVIAGNINRMATVKISSGIFFTLDPMRSVITASKYELDTREVKK